MIKSMIPIAVVGIFFLGACNDTRGDDPRGPVIAQDTPANTLSPETSEEEEGPDVFEADGVAKAEITSVGWVTNPYPEMGGSEALPECHVRITNLSDQAASFSATVSFETETQVYGETYAVTSDLPPGKAQTVPVQYGLLGETPIPVRSDFDCRIVTVEFNGGFDPPAYEPGDEGDSGFGEQG